MRSTLALFILSCFFSMNARAQSDSTVWLRSYPITDYIVQLNDSLYVVQVELPDGITIKEKQFGVVYGVYRNSRTDVVQKGFGRCHLIKGNYYYFTISNNKSGLALQGGDLVYMQVEKPNSYYGRFPQLAAHFMRLTDVYDQPLYDRYLIYDNWTLFKERALIDTIIKDVRFTGDYFLQNDPSQNVEIKSGDYAGKKVLEVMSLCTAKDVEDFIDYVLARPRNYAGREWKVSEIFATWLSEGAPKVIKD